MSFIWHKGTIVLCLFETNKTNQMNEPIIKAKTTEKQKSDFQISIIKHNIDKPKENKVSETGLIILLADAFIEDPARTVEILKNLTK